MMKNDLFFDNVPHIDSLFMEQVLFSFENIPIVFVCIDKSPSRYLCVCDDIIDEESWLIVKISNIKLLEILNDVSTVLSAFKDKKVIIANRKFNQNIQYEIIEYNNINKDELPACDQYLEMKNTLKSYIEKVENDILCKNLRLSLSFYDMPDDKLDISRVAISVKEMITSETNIDFYANNVTEDYPNSFSNDIVSIKIDCQRIADESIALSEEAALIAYAA